VRRAIAIENDVRRGLTATLYATADEVAGAIDRAVGALGDMASAEGPANKITVKIYPETPRELSAVSPTVEIRLKEANDGAVVVTTRVTQYRIIRRKFLGLIPSGPKRFARIQQYETLLRSLHLELSALNGDGQGSVTLMPLVAVG
jgi:hypothetical protein